MNKKIYNVLKEASYYGELPTCFLDELKEEIENSDIKPTVSNIIKFLTDRNNGSDMDIITSFRDAEEIFKNHFEEILDILEEYRSSYIKEYNWRVRDVKYNYESFICFAYRSIVRDWISGLEDMEGK